MKTQPFIRCLLITCFAAKLCAQDTVIHYDNLDDPGFQPNEFEPGSPGGSVRFGPDPGDGGAAQKFTVGEGGNVSSVTVEMARSGFPGGKLIVSIWDVAQGDPGKQVGIVGEIDINSLAPLPADGAAPLELVTFEGSVTGLTPGEDYFLVVDNDDSAIILGRNQGWGVGGVGSPADAEPVAFFTGGRWLRLWANVHLHARIEGAQPTPELKIERAVRISWPESESAGVLERASSPDGPWQPVVEAMQTVDGENRVTILTSTDNAYFRLRND